MRILDKLISFIFTIFVIVIAVAILLVLTGLVNYPVIEGLLSGYVFNDAYKAIVLSSTILVLLAGLKVTVFSSSLAKTSQKSIMVDTPHGKIQINQDTIENVAKNVINEYDSIKDVHTRMTKAKNGINMYMMLSVYQNTNIKDVVTKVQNDVKEQIEETTSVIVRNVDVKIKNVSGTPGDKKSKKNVKTEVTLKSNVAPVATQVPEVATPETPAVNYADPSTFVATPPTGEMKRDANDVLYTVEPNPNSTFNNDQN